MKVLIIGGVAAGTKTAAKLKREDRNIDVTIITESKDISYAGCGLPYYVGGIIEDKDQLIVNTPQSFSSLTGVEVLTEMRATQVKPEEKKVVVLDINKDEEVEMEYDKLVIATGASPVKPPLEGLDLEGVFFMRTPADAIALREYIENNSPKRAVVVGGGFIGLEVAENFAHLNIPTMVVDMADQVPPGFEPEFSEHIVDHLADEGIMLFTGTRVEEIVGEDGKLSAVRTDKTKMKADVAVLSLGIRPNTEFIKDTGIELMKNGTIKVNEYLETNLEDIYSVGDCATVHNRITGEPMWSPMGSTANITGRILAQNISGKREEKIAYHGALGTAIAKLPNLNIGRTGLTEAQAKEAGFDVESVVITIDDKAHYYPGASNFMLKLIADKSTGKFLGLQALGEGSVDKMIDIAVSCLSLEANLEDLIDLDLAYAPPFSTAISPFVHGINVLLNKIEGKLTSYTPGEFNEGEGEDYKIIDVAMSVEVPTAPYIDLTTIEGEVEGLDPEENILISCSKGKRSYLTQNRLKFYGYKNTRVLEGGTLFNGADKLKR